MEFTNCSICGKTKAPFKCGSCESVICKNCAQFNNDDQFSFLPKIPDALNHSVFCNTCYMQVVEPEIVNYNDTMRKAKEVFIFYKSQGKESRTIRRAEAPLKVSDCPDREETLLRLAFLAAHANYNALVDINLTSKKVRNEGYQTLIWNGTAVPANVDADRHNRD